MTAPPRYDGYADWYDANIGAFADVAGRDLLDLLGPGAGRGLDLACGTGINLRRLADAGWAVVGIRSGIRWTCLANRQLLRVRLDGTQRPTRERAPRRWRTARPMRTFCRLRCDGVRLR